LLEIVSSRSTLLAEERGSLTGNQWVGGTSPPPFANCFNELALPNLYTHQNCAQFCAPSRSISALTRFPRSARRRLRGYLSCRDVSKGG